MKKITLSIYLFFGALLYPQTYHIDAENGNDITGDGSYENPFQSINSVWGDLLGGEELLLYNGNYGSIYENYYSDYINLNDWVTVSAAEGFQPEMDSVYYTGFADDGSYGASHNGFIKFKGIKFLNGIYFRGTANMIFEDCIIEKLPPWTGSEYAIEKSAVYLNKTSNVTIDGCEITQTAIAITALGDNISLKNNHIHHITHDGIRVAGLRNSLIENNRIYNLDDGVSDDQASWSRHCDAIHIFIQGAQTADALKFNDNVVVRGNTIYDTESQGIQINNYYQFMDVHNRNITFENNIFGPTVANVFNQPDTCDNLIFRHNTIIYFPQGRTFTSNFRQLTCTNHTFRVGQSPNLQIYNNILVNAPANIPGATIYDYNLIQHPHPSYAYSRFTIIDTNIQYINAENFDGELIANSRAINAGTRLYAPSSLYEYDFWGTERDNRPDIGAYERPFENPEMEEGIQIFNDKKFIFVDDFEDADLQEDIWLQDENTQGISWKQRESDTSFFLVQFKDEFDGNFLGGPIPGSSAMIFSEQGANWKDYSFEFDAFNDYRPNGDGPIILAVNDKNFYWFDISRDSGRIVRFMSDGNGNQLSDLLLESETIEMPHHGLQKYAIKVEHTENGIKFDVDVNNDGSIDLSYTDNQSSAISRFSSGGIGFFLDFYDGYSKINYDNIRVTVDEFSENSDINSHTTTTKDYRLFQNYPNPFNPTTSIKYQVPRGEYIELKIFDILGREVTSLVNEQKQAGTYTVEWNGTNSAGVQVGSGVYFYQLRTGSGFLETKKMMLLR
ncbi:MAG: T9SS type A sorting domain-containing protein [Ignavibacteria bacterium]|nr:T9SS type A sorting domain-containing protein [Ignavibacteria bacterium]